MRAKLGIAALLLGLAAWPSAVGASGAEACGPRWTLVAPMLDCASRIVIGPGNDTRINLLLLVRDQAGLDGHGLAYQADGWLTSYYGHTFFDWDVLNATLDPSSATSDYDPYVSPPEFYGRRCQKRRGRRGAVPRRDRPQPADRCCRPPGARRGARGDRGLCHTEADYADFDVRLAPEDLGLPHTFASPEAREFGTYLAGAAAFYISDWRSARERFAVLRTAKDAWVRETALYMAARSELGAAAATAVGRWGEFDVDEADQDAAGRAAKAFEAYLAAYPRGSYAASAAGLVRRAAWLEGAVDKQGRTYARMLDTVDPEEARDLIVEIDDKFLFRDGAGDAAEGPWLLAVHDLLRMRNCNEPGQPEYSCGDAIAPLTAGELAAQEAAFAGHAALYAFVQANFAFYVAHDYRAVLRLLPDDARQPAYSPLAFSRQVLRGMALAELKDRKEAGFWQELIGGAKGAYQRPTVELGLALNWERAGQVAKVFAPRSPIEDAPIRRVLLEHSAGPEVLRAVAGAADRPRDERDLATYVLLYKQLSRGLTLPSGGTWRWSAPRLRPKPIQRRPTRRRYRPASSSAAGSPTDTRAPHCARRWRNWRAIRAT